MLNKEKAPVGVKTDCETDGSFYHTNQDKVRCLEAALIFLIDGMQMRKNYDAILQLVLFYSSFYYCRPFKARFQ